MTISGPRDGGAATVVIVTVTLASWCSNSAEASGSARRKVLRLGSQRASASDPVIKDDTANIATALPGRSVIVRVRVED